jgi:hypothetical protein
MLAVKQVVEEFKNKLILTYEKKLPLHVTCAGLTTWGL